MSAETNSHQKPLAALMVGATGVVYGDIGTSPLYALKEVFAGHHPLPLDEFHVLGLLSVVFWTIILVVSIKYISLMMRADNRGEGGCLALLALVSQATQGGRLRFFVVVLGIFAAALFYGDSMITPAISVLSAVEGVKVAAPVLEPYVIPLTVIILTVLFALQRGGTATVGAVFGPVMVLWFGILAVLGSVSIIQNPGILAALDPSYAFEFFEDDWVSGFFSLGAVVLVITGGEALYADMGHFGKRPIRWAWFGLVMPALLINYFGQGALLLRDPTTIENPFFLLAPEWALIPMVCLATLATVIASQAVISGAFSVAQQAVQLGYLPRMVMVQTSAETRGQIYLPFINWSLFIFVIALVLGFQSSSSLAYAYGIAVTGTMMIDTVLIFVVMIVLWKWHKFLAISFLAVFLTIDLTFFAANVPKIASGGWFPLAIGGIVFILLMTWKTGRKLVFQEIQKEAMTLPDFVEAIGDSVRRVPGTAVFMTSSPQVLPHALLHNLKHNKVIHDRVISLTVLTAEVPYVPPSQRVEVEALGKNFYRIMLRYGFKDEPNIPAALKVCEGLGEEIDLMDTSFFVSRETVIPSRIPGMALWRERLFTWMSRNAVTATDFFKIPPNRVVELGAQVEI